MKLYYGEQGGQVMGPVTARTLRAEIKAGRTGAGVLVSRDGGEPWVAWDWFEKMNEIAFAMPAPAVASAIRDEEDEAKPKTQEVSRKREPGSGGMSFWLGLIGAVQLGLAAIFGFFAFGQALIGQPALIWFYYMVCGLIGGIVFLAMAEALDRLGEIARALREK